MKPRFLVSSFYLGFFSLFAQTVLLREMLAVFSGNEIVLGAILAFWLLWVGLGSLLGNRFLSRMSGSPTALGWSYLLASFSLLLALFLVRHARILWGCLPGETIPLMQTGLTAALSPLPLCFLLGLAFVLNASFFSARLGGNLTNRVYLVEAVGAACGGVVVTFLLIPSLSNIDIAFLTPLTSSVVALYLWVSEGRKVKMVLASVVAVGTLALFAAGLPGRIDRESLKTVWRGFSILDSIDSRYGKIVVTGNEDLVSFYENSSLGFYLPNQAHAEETIHLALLQLEDPQSLLLIGGGPGDNLNEAFKYVDLKIDYVELDPELVRTARRHLPLSPEIGERVRFLFVDGRFFVRGAEKSYDAVILDLPEPLSAQVNRFYTLEFFREVKRLLRGGGVFSFKIPSSENYISPERAQLLSSLSQTMRLVFEEVSILPGESNILLGTDRSGGLTGDPDTLLRRLTLTGIETKFINESFLYDRLSDFRIDMLESGVSAAGGKANTDLNPICYYYGGLLWGSQFKSGGRALRFFYGLPRGWPWAFVFVLVVAVYLLSRVRDDRLGATSRLLVFSLGFAGMVTEVVILLSYQTFRGYLYSRIGLLLALFMVGLSLGAHFASRFRRERQGLVTPLLYCQVAFVIYILVLILSLGALSSQTTPASATEAVLYAFMLFAGLFGGAQFAFGNSIIMAGGNARDGGSYGTGYGIDLVGSAVGALFCSAFFVPLLGLQQTLGLPFVFALPCILLLSCSALGRGRP